MKLLRKKIAAFSMAMLPVPILLLGSLFNITGSTLPGNRSNVSRASSLSRPQTTPEERAAKLISEGVAALDRNETAAARALFLKALEADPRNLTAHTYLGVLADRAGDLVEAASHFAIAARLAPTSASTRNNYGAVLLRLGRTQLAATEFEASLRLDPSQPSALVNLAQIRFAEGGADSLRASQDLFKRAYEIAPDAEIARALTIVSLILKDTAATTLYFRDYSTRVAAGEGNETTLSAVARAELGAALFEAGLLTESATELSAALSASPSNVDVILKLARVYLAGNDIPAAGRTLESAVARGIDKAPIYALLAEVYEKSGHIEHAIPAMRLAIERDPQQEIYRFNYGLMLTSAYAPAAAIIRLEESLKVFPRSSRLWFALGIANFKANKNTEAATAFTRALEFDPKFAPALAYLGLTYVELTQYAEAVKLYERALSINGQMGVVHYMLADALLKVDRDSPDVEAHLKQAVKLDPAFAPARLALAKLFQRTGRLTEAVAEFESVIKLDPNLAEAYYQLGRVYVLLKRPDEASVVLAKFKEISERQKENIMNERLDIVRRLANVNF
jgi:Tfp pilus assembly protein PilF